MYRVRVGASSAELWNPTVLSFHSTSCWLNRMGEEAMADWSVETKVQGEGLEESRRRGGSRCFFRGMRMSRGHAT